MVREAVPEATACRPNFSASGRKRRQTVAAFFAAVTVVGLVDVIVMQTSPLVRASVGLPAFLAAVGWLQVRRNTCVAHAAKGTFEHDDFSASKVDAEQAAASRRVAKTIYRDSGLFALVVAVLAFASAWVH